MWSKNFYFSFLFIVIFICFWFLEQNVQKNNLKWFDHESMDKLELIEKLTLTNSCFALIYSWNIFL